MAELQALFTFTSRLDGKNYMAVWDRDHAVLRVDPVAAVAPQYAPPPASWPAPLLPPIDTDGQIDVDVVRAFEEGRLSHPKAERLYTKPAHAKQATAYDFGTFFRA